MISHDLQTDINLQYRNGNLYIPLATITLKFMWLGSVLKPSTHKL